MKATQLIPNHYYSYPNFIFKFNKIDNEVLDAYYYFNNLSGTFIFKGDGTRLTFSDNTGGIDRNYKEISFLEIVELLPQNHPDRIAFRKQRINKLLFSYGEE